MNIIGNSAVGSDDSHRGCNLSVYAEYRSSYPNCVVDVFSV
ncbi:hypothetical protein CL3_21550 [butyrate-producing bacterium SM4/1]|nr:hypothetical protein CL3_21550 [butyrate-producing bacterium SM4/1]